VSSPFIFLPRGLDVVASGAAEARLPRSLGVFGRLLRHRQLPEHPDCRRLGRCLVCLDTDVSGIQVSWSETSNDTDWASNLTRARVEGRYATSIFQPLAAAGGTARGRDRLRLVGVAGAQPQPAPSLASLMQITPTRPRRLATVT
jgi:hypothetical protein